MGGLEGGGGEWRVTFWVKFQSGEMKKVPEMDGSYGFTRVQMDLMLLNCACQNGKINMFYPRFLNSCSCCFFYNLKSDY